MTNANTLMKNMVTTQKAANKWTENAYRTASTELYELLAECYAHTQFYRSADISFKLQLNQLLRDAKHTVNEGTRIETKVVRVVFGEVFTGAIGRSRGAIYSKVLTAAFVTCVPTQIFPPEIIHTALPRLSSSKRCIWLNTFADQFSLFITTSFDWRSIDIKEFARKIPIAFFAHVNGHFYVNIPLQ